LKKCRSLLPSIDRDLVWSVLDALYVLKLIGVILVFFGGECGQHLVDLFTVFVGLASENRILVVGIKLFLVLKE